MGKMCNMQILISIMAFAILDWQLKEMAIYRGFELINMIYEK
jgi:hypothetical protein